MLFRLDTPTEAKLNTFTARTEKHGEEDVAALTLGLSITGPNLLLDKISETLRHAFYRVADDYTEALDNIDPPTTVLRTKQLTGALPISVPEIKGGTLYVEYGIGEDMVFGDCTVKAWKAECLEGGTCTLSFKVSTNDIDEEEAGHLFGKQGQMLMIRFEPPKPMPIASEDKGAPLFDEPSEARLEAERAFEGAIDGDDDGQDAGEHLADDVERNGESDSASPKPRKRKTRAAA